MGFRAASNGCPPSQYRAGMIYLNGMGGVKANKTEAIKWFMLAADNGDQDAIKKLIELGY